MIFMESGDPLRVAGMQPKMLPLTLAQSRMCPQLSWTLIPPWKEMKRKRHPPQSQVFTSVGDRGF